MKMQLVSMGNNYNHDIPVIIIGAGSVGLSLAAELGWRGINCTLFEKQIGLNNHPRANAVANRTMEYYRRWGIDKHITNAGIPPDHPADYYWVSSLHGRELHRISLPAFRKIKEIQNTDANIKEEHTWSPYLKTITGQNEVEEILHKYISNHKLLEIHFENELIDFDQDETGVNCKIRNTKTDKIVTVRGKYLLACDGGKSFIREKLEIKLKGRADLAKFVSIYFKAPHLMECHKFGTANIFFPLHIDYAGFLLNWDGGKTFTYHLMLKDGENWNDINPILSIEALLGCKTSIEIITVQPWAAHALVADKYRSGRIFLVGDSAHLFSPTGGFGMNTGVSDAIDIAWKIQAMLEGWGCESLLDSYFAERHSIGVRNTKEAADCFDQLYSVMQYGDELDDDSEEGKALRKKLSLKLMEQDKLIASSGTLLGYRYNNSPIIVSDETPETKDNPRRYIPTARPGHRAPHIWIEEGISILDILGKDFSLLVFKKNIENLNKFKNAAISINFPLKILEIDDIAAIKLYGHNLVLVRPDLMVAWRSNVVPKDPLVILNTVRGAKINKKCF